MSESMAAAAQEQPDRRRVERSALSVSASIREPGRGRMRVRLIDISTHGCRIEATTGPNPDSWLLLSIAGLETQYCRVAWACQEFAGLEFETPLAEAVLERLLSEQKQLSEKAIGDMRSLATRAHRLATIQTDEHTPVLSEISRKMAIEAVVEGLKLSESKGR